MKKITHALKRKLRNCREAYYYLLGKIFIRNTIGPDNHFYKRNRIFKIQRTNKYDVMLETGTFYGQMVSANVGYFSKIISIEIYKPLFVANNNYYSNYKNVDIIYGDSAQMLSEIMPVLLEKSVLFWLDGHYSGHGTGMGALSSPILDEIGIILKYCPTKFCIIIDDLRLFNNTDGYPFKDDIFHIFNTNNIQYHFFEDKDALIIKSIDE